MLAWRPAVSMMSRSASLSCAASSDRTATLAGIGARRGAGDRDVQPRAPRFELFGGGGAKSIGGAEMDGASLLLRPRPSFAAVVVLPLPFTPTSRMTSGLLPNRQRRRNADRARHFFPQPRLGFFRRAGETVFPEFLHPFGGQLDAEIGFDQQRFPIDFVSRRRESGRPA